MQVTKKQVQSVKKFVLKNKTPILAGSLVVVMLKNRSLKKQNAELMAELEVALEGVMSTSDARSLFERFFGSKG